jgi:hypothetical protein
VGVQEIRWDKGGTVRAGDYIFSVDSVLLGKPEGKRDMKDLGMDGRIILRWMIRDWDGRA